MGKKNYGKELETKMAGKKKKQPDRKLKKAI